MDSFNNLKGSDAAVGGVSGDQRNPEMEQQLGQKGEDNKHEDAGGSEVLNSHITTTPDQKLNRFSSANIPPPQYDGSNEENDTRSANSNNHPSGGHQNRNRSSLQMGTFVDPARSAPARDYSGNRRVTSHDGSPGIYQESFARQADQPMPDVHYSDYHSDDEENDEYSSRLAQGTAEQPLLTTRRHGGYQDGRYDSRNYGATNSFSVPGNQGRIRDRSAPFERSAIPPLGLFPSSDLPGNARNFESEHRFASGGMSPHDTPGSYYGSHSSSRYRQDNRPPRMIERFENNTLLFQNPTSAQDRYSSIPGSYPSTMRDRYREPEYHGTGSFGTNTIGDTAAVPTANLFGGKHGTSSKLEGTQEKAFKAYPSMAPRLPNIGSRNTRKEEQRQSLFPNTGLNESARQEITEIVRDMSDYTLDAYIDNITSVSPAIDLSRHRTNGIQIPQPSVIAPALEGLQELRDGLQRRLNDPTPDNQFHADLMEKLRVRLSESRADLDGAKSAFDRSGVLHMDLKQNGLLQGLVYKRELEDPNFESALLESIEAMEKSLSNAKKLVTKLPKLRKDLEGNTNGMGRILGALENFEEISKGFGGVNQATGLPEEYQSVSEIWKDLREKEDRPTTKK